MRGNAGSSELGTSAGFCGACVSFLDYGCLLGAGSAQAQQSLSSVQGSAGKGYSLHHFPVRLNLRWVRGFAGLVLRARASVLAAKDHAGGHSPVRWRPANRQPGNRTTRREGANSGRFNTDIDYRMNRDPT